MPINRRSWLASVCVLILSGSGFAATAAPATAQSPQKTTRHHHRHHHHAHPVTSAAPTTPTLPDSSGLAGAYPPFGPMEVSMGEGSQFGFLMGWHWVNDITTNSAFGLQVNFGSNEFLLGGTWAYGFDPQNRVKITAEHLAQTFNFDFVTGNKQQWAGQNDGGAVFEHFLAPDSRVHSLLLGGYYGQAESETVQNKTFTVDQNKYIDHQAFAGATYGGGELGATFEPWSLAHLQVLGNYDALHDDPQYHAHIDKQGPGATIDLLQVVNGHFKVEGYATARSYYSQVAATASYLLHTCPNKHVELNLTASHFSGDLYTTSDNRITLSCAFRWGGNNDAPAPSYLNDDMDSLRSWTVKPAVVIPEVQIVQDEAVVSNP